MTQPSSFPEPTDTGLVFDELVEEHYGRLCGFAYRFVGSRDVAEDIVQDVFTQLWCRREQFDVRDPLPYLYRAIRNRAVNYRRQLNVRNRSHDRVAAEAEDRAEAAGAIPALEADEFAAALARAVDELPERCRLIFTMSREQDLSYGDIARILGISVKTVETQMTRALRRLRTRLDSYLGLVVAIASAWR